MLLSQDDFVNRIADDTGYTKKVVKEIMKSVFNQIKYALSRNESLSIGGFGHFYTTQEKRRPFDFKTNSSLDTLEVRLPRFQPARGFKISIRNGDILGEVEYEDGDEEI